MKAIKRINHVGLRVRDLEAPRAFYEKLGFEFFHMPRWARARRRYGTSIGHQYQFHPEWI